MDVFIKKKRKAGNYEKNHFQVLLFGDGEMVVWLLYHEGVISFMGEFGGEFRGK